MKRQPSTAGFTMIEILFAGVFLSLALMGFMVLFSSSNRGTVDAQQETIAYCLANEAMEWTTGLGFAALSQLTRNPVSPDFKGLQERLVKIGLGNFQPVKDLTMDDGTTLTYPDEYRKFRRAIEIQRETDSLLLVRVSVQGKSSGLFRKDLMTLEKLVGPE